MEGFISLIPKSPIGWLGLTLAIVLAIFTFINRKRFDQLDSLEKSNNTLRSLVGDQTLEINTLKSKVSDLTSRFEESEKQNLFMRSLIEEKDKATIEYRNNAEIAMKKQDLILEQLAKQNTNISNLYKLISRPSAN